MNGTLGDDPIIDMLFHGKHPFPPELEELILKVHEMEPNAVVFLDAYHWAAGENLDRAEEQTKEMLNRYPVEGLAYLSEIAERESNPGVRHNMKFAIWQMTNSGAKKVPFDVAQGSRSTGMVDQDCKIQHSSHVQSSPRGCFFGVFGS